MYVQCLSTSIFQVGECVGYHVRLDHRAARGPGSITFYTVGMLLQQVLNNPTLEGVSHVIIDEVHERSAGADLLLILLRRLLSTTGLRVILMSASTDTGQLREYFGADNTALVEVPGTLHPLERRYLPDVLQTLSLLPQKYDLDSATTTGTSQQRIVNPDLIVDVIRAIDATRPPGGAILCFLTGWQDISLVQTRLLKDGEGDGLWILPLHSHLSAQDQVQQSWNFALFNIGQSVIWQGVAGLPLER